MNSTHGDLELLTTHRLDYYDANLARRKALVEEMKPAVEKRLHAAGLNHFRVEARVKSRASFEQKVRKNPTREVEDVVGVRILVFFRSDLVVAEEVVRKMLILEQGSYVDKADLLQDSEFGYRSIQFIGRTKKGGWDAYPDPMWQVSVNSGDKVEVQIRTLLEHGFAEVEHDIRYKPGPVDITADVHRRFALTAALLEQADTNLDDIRSILHSREETRTTSRAADIKGSDAERFTRASRASIDLDRDIRIALDLKHGHVLKSVREVERAASLAGWTTFWQYQHAVESYGELGRRLAIACADTSRGVVFIDFEPQHAPIGYPGIGLYWTALAVALGVNDLDPKRPHGQISIPDGRLEEFRSVARYLVRNPDVPAPTVRDRYRAQAAPAGSTRAGDFRSIELT
ncbi:MULTISPECIES: GTP pyrophosphokinase [Microbacterium]|uniref:GTP pyrophosphokinase n=1 Tax=Microbacterium TaxID=33882 RepID=UPI00217D37B2|nr:MULTISPECIES: hypothetical protein [Microbacterium]UWF76684.1 hypothetical protein JSY13_07350 [Microbacterium neungamense]WCM54834.1 hypothetical protein JRG78_07350 [Microbacterium sp. EF45047]